MAWLWGALMPHPPIIVPEVGQGREREAAATLQGMQSLTEKLAGQRPDRLLLLSPHQPYAPGALCINGASNYTGSLAAFGAPGVAIRCSSFPPGPLADVLKGAGIPVAMANERNVTKDHGAVVPLYFLSRAWGGLPPTLIASPVGLSPEQALALGKALAEYDDSGTWALLASGDLSHCLKEGGPAGFSPAGKAHDEAVVSALESGDPSPLLNLSPKSRADAKECGLRSVLALMGLCGSPLEVFSYEGPFGVGYCTAFGMPSSGNAAGSKRPVSVTVTPAKTAARPRTEDQSRHDAEGMLPGLARQVLEEYLATGGVDDVATRSASEDAPLWSKPAACFVSIKTKDGALRGCIGTILPTKKSLREEIIGNAVSAAVRDPRFPPMSKKELPDVVISVDVLSTPEKIGGLEELDPAVYGVIVTRQGRRGLLLPDLEGVDTVAKQLGIAAQKGGIDSLDGAVIERFTVSRYVEKG